MKFMHSTTLPLSMGPINRLFWSFLLLLAHNLVGAQMSKEAWDNYKSSRYEKVLDFQESDAVIIFDRTYYETTAKGDKVERIKTVHRKIKINSLYGLEQFNKLYIPTLDDLHYNIKFVDCKAKTIKPNNKVVVSDTSLMVETTLPANVPFFYKKEGSVKLLAIRDITIGDEIEYIYAVKSSYQTSPQHYSHSEYVSFSGNNDCLERSIFFESDDFITKIWPRNFRSGVTGKSSFVYKNGQKISLARISRNSEELYANDIIDQPYIVFTTTKYIAENDDTWKDLLKDFGHNIKKSKKTAIFDGLKFTEFQYQLNRIKGVTGLFDSLLNTLNAPVEANLHVYRDIEDEIEIAWYHANIISKLMKRLNVPLQFNFVVDKNSGTLDHDFVSRYQFDNIIISFVDEQGQKHFMPLLEPHSNLDEIKLKYQGTECFTISQESTGRKTFLFDKIPDLGVKNKISTEVKVVLKKLVMDSLNLEVSNKVSYQGDSWLNIKPYIIHLLNDSAEKENSLNSFILGQLIPTDKIDSVYKVEHSLDSVSFVLSYSYSTSQAMPHNSNIISFQPEQYIISEFYPSYGARDNRTVSGYLYNEPELAYSLSFSLGNKFNWIENVRKKDNLENAFGVFSSDYSYKSPELNLSFGFRYKKEMFKKTEWPDVLDLRDKSAGFFGGNLYFVKL